MRYFRAFDEFLLRYIFEAFAQWFQRLTGLTAIWFSKVFLMFIPLVMSINMYFDCGGNVPMFVVIGLPIIIIIWYYILFMPPLHRYEEKCIKRSIAGFGNPIRVHSEVRLLMLIFFGSTIFIALHRYQVYATVEIFFLGVGFIYFLSSNILPPGTSKLKQWLTIIGTTFSKKNYIVSN